MSFLYEQVAAKALYAMDPETAHQVGLRGMGLVGAIPPLRWCLERGLTPKGGKPIEAFGLKFPNHIGLAAGFDKDGLGWRGAAIGGSFRYVARDQVLATVEPIYDRSLHRRAGGVTRLDGASQTVNSLTVLDAGGVNSSQPAIEYAGGTLDALIVRRGYVVIDPEQASMAGTTISAVSIGAP